MRRSVFTVAAAALLLAASGPALAGRPARGALIHKVDSVTALVTERKLTISATGAVASGGWKAPYLRVKAQRGAEAHTLVVRFLATPPAKGTAVIQGFLPVAASLTLSLPRYATTDVKVVAQTNAVTVPITVVR